jgi:NAD(P)-dependent dehydrogenase (short-subunit alcohol dehydrogenase family)
VRSALVTGSSTGIGRATALRLDREGWRVFAAVRREEDAAVLQGAGSDRLAPVMLDVTDADQIAAAAKLVGDEVGEAGLDGLVNNAGIAVLSPLETITQAFLPLIRRATGRVVFVSSIGGRMALPFGGPYHASKYGIEAVADCLRQELRPWKIDVAVIEPGSIDTAIWASGERIAEEVSDRAHDSQEELYGKTIESFRVAVRRTADRGIPPEKVARSILHALTARRPRTRYVVGADARGQALARRVLPDRAFDALVARVMRV